jgi:hypothetical protein
MVQVSRLSQEIADHREDLKQAALSDGLSETDAESRANALLGDPYILAKQQMIILRRSSWWGRHFLIGFCLLPLFFVPVLWGLLLTLDLSLEFALGYGWDSKKLHAAADNAAAFHHLAMAVHCADYFAIALVTFLFCWLAYRSVVGVRWMVISCAICSLYSLFISIHISPHFFSIGLSWSPQWIRAAIPLLIASIIYVSQRRKTHGFRENVAV